jgi:hypothetical protein
MPQDASLLPVSRPMFLYLHRFLERSQEVDIYRTMLCALGGLESIQMFSRREFCSDPVPMYSDSTISHCDDLIRRLRIPFCYHNAHHPFGTPSDASAAYSCLALTSTLAIA